MTTSSNPQRVAVGALRFFPPSLPADPALQEQVQGLWDTENSFIILSGPPGVGKTRAAEDFIQHALQAHNAPHSVAACRVSNIFADFRTTVISDRDLETTLLAQGIRFVWDICVLHPQYSYEDLVRGYRMSTTSTDMPKLEVREGLLGFIARVTAVLDRMLPKTNVPRSVLILDEINRAPIGQLFGEALYALDRRGHAATTPYDLAGIGSSLVIPPSVLLLGTMNSVDRAVAGFDFALRRRFAIVNVVPHKEAIQRRYNSRELADAGVIATTLFEAIESSILTATQSGMVPLSELVLGHSYFIAPASILTKDEAVKWVAQACKFKIIPTLLDYLEQGLIVFKDDNLSRLVGGKVLKNAEPLGAFQNRDLIAELQALGPSSG